VLGPTVFEYSANEKLIEALSHLGRRKNTTFMPLYNGANTRGALELGVLGEILPGVARARGKGISLVDVIEGKARPKVIYLVGEVPFFQRPNCDFVIAQCIYHPPFPVDVFLPAASFAEAEGTLTNVEGRVQELVMIEDLPDGAVTGFARPDWSIFGRLAEKMGHTGFKYKNTGAVLKEISQTVAGFPAKPDRKRRRLSPKTKLPVQARKVQSAGKGSYFLVAEPAGFGHRGMDLSSKVEGLEELALEEGFRLHPDDLRAMRVDAGDSIAVKMNGLTIEGPARADPECPPGSVYYHRPVGLGGLGRRAGFEPLYRLRISPARVQVQSVKSAGRKGRKKNARDRLSAAAG
jgi:anaerobic selenocysteine-containing dehydrogenase